MNPPVTQTRRRQPRMPIEARRASVLDAALRLITRDGYAASSMEAIAREAQLAKPRIYAAYNGRGPLLSALLEREEQRVIAALAEAMPQFTPESDFDATLTSAATNLLQAVREHPESWQLLLLAADDAPPEVRRHFQTGRQFALDQLRALVHWGAAKRPDLGNVDLELLARSLLAIGEQAVELTLTHPDEFTPERYGTFARELLHALGPHPEP